MRKNVYKFKDFFKGGPFQGLQARSLSKRAQHLRAAYHAQTLLAQAVHFIQISSPSFFLFINENITWLTFQGFTDGFQGGESYSAGMPLFEKGKIGDRYIHHTGEFGQGHFPLDQQKI
jgi:hypothetical protein